MTSQEVRALIDAKIKGQGTNVDAGSVLPAILNGILDLIDSGGGGGTSDAVQYIPQILTEPQQMQARKNQGLYYSEGGGDVIINWDGSSPVIEQQVVFYKVSTAHPSSDLLKTIKVKNNGVEQTYNVASQKMFISDGIYSILGDSVYDIPICIVITAESFTDPESGLTLSQGIWFTTNGENIYTSQLVYGQTETIHHIEPKYIKDMYYKEPVAGGEIAWDGVSTGLDSINVWGTHYYKVSDDISIVNALPTVVWGNNSEDITEWIDSPSVVQSGHCYISNTDIWVLDNAVFIDNPNYSSTETQPITGVYMQSKGTNVPVTISWDAYYITHKIPSEYIPSSGIDFAIEGTIGDYPGVRRGGAYMDIYNGFFDFTIKYTLPAPEAGAMRFYDLKYYKVFGNADISFSVTNYHLLIDTTGATPGDTALYMLDFYFYDTIDDERTGKEYHFGFPIFFEILQGE